MPCKWAMRSMNRNIEPGMKRSMMACYPEIPKDTMLSERNPLTNTGYGYEWFSDTYEQYLGELFTFGYLIL